MAWPRYLAQWEVREAGATSRSGVYEPRKFLPHPMSVRPSPSHARINLSNFSSMVINLARAVDAPYLLPSAFYDLSRCYPSDSAAGYTCPRTQETHHLSDLDLTHLLKGKEHASRFLSSFVINQLQHREPTPSCSYRTESDPNLKGHCQTAFEAITFEILRDVNGVVCHRSSDPLFAIMDAEIMQSRDELAASYGVSMRLCDFCRSEFSATVDDAREELWRRLPQWFGITLQPWP